MVKPLKFARMETSFEGLMSRAIHHFNRFIGDDIDGYHWVFIENPERMARALEVLAEDLPEEDIAEVVPRMPYLVLLFRRVGLDPYIPVEATLAFLSVVNRSGMITILRQCTDRSRLAPSFELDASTWAPLLFLCGGVADLDADVEEAPDHCSFF